LLKPENALGYMLTAINKLVEHYPETAVDPWVNLVPLPPVCEGDKDSCINEHANANEKPSTKAQGRTTELPKYATKELPRARQMFEYLQRNEESNQTANETKYHHIIVSKCRES